MASTIERIDLGCANNLMRVLICLTAPHIGIAILTTIIFAMWAYECDPSDYSLTGWLALISLAITFVITIVYNVLRVIKLCKSF